MLGHPDKMLHPLKHEFRLEVCESTKAAFHQVIQFHVKLTLCFHRYGLVIYLFISLSTLILPQLLMMKHSSVFINDSAEAGRLIQEMPSKGPIYSAFRYDTNVPDMLGTSLRRKTHDLDIRAEY